MHRHMVLQSARLFKEAQTSSAPLPGEKRSKPCASSVPGAEIVWSALPCSEVTRIAKNQHCTNSGGWALARIGAYLTRMARFTTRMGNAAPPVPHSSSENGPGTAPCRWSIAKSYANGSSLRTLGVLRGWPVCSRATPVCSVPPIPSTHCQSAAWNALPGLCAGESSGSVQ